MPKNKHKIDAGEVLNSFVLPKLEDHTIESSKKRIWNNISHQINVSEGNPESLEIVQEVTFWQRNMKFFVVTSLVMFIAVSGIGGGILYNSNNTKNQNNSDTRTAIAAVTPPQKETIRELAASRFAQINGVSFDEFKAVTIESPEEKGTPQATTLDSSKATELSNKTETKSLFYTEQEIKTDSANTTSISIPGYGKVESPLVDFSKPVTLKNWYSVNYNKTTLEQEGKLLLLTLDSPDYSVSFLGGKYAIETKYKIEKLSVAGISVDGTVATNPEVAIMKFILDSGEANNAAIEKIDDKEYIVIRVPISTSEPEKYYKKFFMDKDSFKLSIIEEYFDGIKEVSIKNIQSVEQKNIDPTVEINFQELINKSIEVKTIENFEPTTSSTYVNNPTFEDFVTNSDLVYLTVGDNSSINLSTYKSKEVVEKSEYAKLSETVDFDPSYSPRGMASDILAEYSQKDLGIYYVRARLPVTFSSTAGTDVKNENVKVMIEGKEFDAVLSTFTHNPETATPTVEGEVDKAIEESRILEIRIENEWLQVRTTPESKVKLTNGMKFSKMSLEKAKDLDSTKKILGTSVTPTTIEKSKK